jgi:hypothetical protein
MTPAHLEPVAAVCTRHRTFVHDPGWNPSAACSCGWRGPIRPGRGAQGAYEAARADEAAHLETVTARGLPPDTLDEHVPSGGVIATGDAHHTQKGEAVAARPVELAQDTIGWQCARAGANASEVIPDAAPARPSSPGREL